MASPPNRRPARQTEGKKVKYRIIKQRLIRLKGGKCAENVGDTFDGKDVDPTSNIGVLLKRGFVEKVTSKVEKITKEVLAAPMQKARSRRGR